MQERSNDPITYFQMQRISQITDAHCGPAVIQMLLSNVGVSVTQEEVALAAGIQDVIEMHGTRVDQMAVAVRKLAPNAQFWYKDHSTLDEIYTLLHDHRYPVGIEWQGLFDEEGEEEEDPEPDYGHYSVITHIDREKRELVIVDPYKNYVLRDRIFTLDEFDSRWWDYNMVPNPKTGKSVLTKDDHMMFIVTPTGITFPEQIGMTAG
jgi:hypothetical protein